MQSKKRRISDIGETIACLFVVLLLATGTYWRNRIWNSTTELWADSVKKSPNKERPHNNLGYALGQQGNYRAAVDHLTQALRIKPNHARAQNNLGNVFFRQGKYQEAVDHFTQALQIDPNNEEAHNNLGEAFTEQGKYEKAVFHLTEALRIKPNNPILHYNLGIVFVRQGKRNLALKEYETLRTMNQPLASILSQKISK